MACSESWYSIGRIIPYAYTHTHTHTHMQLIHYISCLMWPPHTHTYWQFVCTHVGWTSVYPIHRSERPIFCCCCWKKYNKHTTVHMHTHRTSTYTHTEIERKRSVHSFTYLFAHSWPYWLHHSIGITCRLWLNWNFNIFHFALLVCLLHFGIRSSFASLFLSHLFCFSVCLPSILRSLSFSLTQTHTNTHFFYHTRIHLSLTSLSHVSV